MEKRKLKKRKLKEREKDSVLIIDGNLLARKSFYKFKNLRITLKKGDLLKLFPKSIVSKIENINREEEGDKENNIEEQTSPGNGEVIKVNMESGISKKIKEKLSGEMELVVPTGLSYGFLRSLLVGYEKTEAKEIIVCYDPLIKESNPIRYSLDDKYKRRKRNKRNEEKFYTELSILRVLLYLLGIKQISTSSFEADDLLQYYSKKEYKSRRTFILTNDSDIYQLLSAKDQILKIGANYSIYSKEDFIKEFGIKNPALWRDVKALGGCSTDKIKGVKGISEKSAIELVEKFGEIKNILKELDGKNIPRRLRTALIKEREEKYKNLKLSYSLVRLYGKDPRLEKELSILENKKDKKESFKELLELLKALRFKSLLDEKGRKLLIEIRRRNVHRNSDI